MKVPEVTSADYKDWAKRHDVKLNVSDDELEDALSRANRIAQKYEDEREASRKQHLCQDSSVGRAAPCPTSNNAASAEGLGSDAMLVAGSGPAPGNIKQEKQE